MNQNENNNVNANNSIIKKLFNNNEVENENYNVSEKQLPNIVLAEEKQ